MQIPSNLSAVVVVATIGITVAVNLVIGGLILIAVVHDGTAATQIATTFQQILSSAITAIGTLIGAYLGGKAVHSAMIEAQQQNGQGH